MGVLEPLAKIWFKWNGWEAVDEQCPDKCVIVAAPHTSNWDLPYSVAIGALTGKWINWAGKHTVFKWPWKTFMVWIGGIPIHRGKAGSNYVENLAKEFQKRDKLRLVIAPEGTRSRTEFWRTGFYYIAKAADVPIVAGFLDYNGKAGGFGKVIYPIGTIQEVFEQLRDFYDDVEGHHHELFGPVRSREDFEGA